MRAFYAVHLETLDGRPAGELGVRRLSRDTGAAGRALRSEAWFPRHVRKGDQRHHDLPVPRPDVVGCYGLGSLHVEAEPSPMPGSGRLLPRPAIVVSGSGVKETPTS